jgi:DNA-binding NarL/FixJ family response regulator
MHACAALLDATAAGRAGLDDARAAAERAADRYRALEWPLHEALALEAAGRTDAALALYRSCGSIADVRRLETRAPIAGRNVGGERLSPRERQVAALVARGLTNRAIAGELCVGEKTIEKYVSAIYAKLGFTSRTQLAAHVARGEASA